VPDEEVHVGANRVNIQAFTAKRRDGGGESSLQHGRHSKLLAVPSNLRTERDGDVLRITMARPDRRNAFDAAVIAELAEAFVGVGRARAVVLAGDGPSFSAGADVDWMRSSADLSYTENVADANALRAMLEAIDGCPAPVVARVQGHALGGGAGLVAAADIAIAAPDAVFAFSEVKLGIIPAVISPFALARIGAGAARRYFVTGERFDAETALRIGLVHAVAEDLDDAVERLVSELLSAGPQAARWAKRLVRERPDGPETARWIAERRTSEEGQEGLRAFVEKRPPSWG
jgi:methylglutaconyl-CoA hydratase